MSTAARRPWVSAALQGGRRRRCRCRRRLLPLLTQPNLLFPSLQWRRFPQPCQLPRWTSTHRARSGASRSTWASPLSRSVASCRCRPAERCMLQASARARRGLTATSPCIQMNYTDHSTASTSGVCLHCCRCQRHRMSPPPATRMCNSLWWTAPATPRSSEQSSEGRRCGGRWLYGCPSAPILPGLVYARWLAAATQWPSAAQCRPPLAMCTGLAALAAGAGALAAESLLVPCRRSLT